VSLSLQRILWGHMKGVRLWVRESSDGSPQ
jgi:hypothetical protein